MPVTVRLDHDLQKKLNALSHQRLCSKSEIIKESLKSYLDSQLASSTPYSLGADLFGRVGSGLGNLSTDRKKILKRKIREKNLG